LKNLVIIAFLFAFVAFSNVAQAQKVKTIKLEQTPGTFTQKELKLKPSKYIFKVSNKGVDYPVGFVVAPADKTDQANHIKEAYTSKTIKDGEVASSKEVTLEKGEYVYFCPLNPTPFYKIIVK
jgi:hypothetical protein